MSLSPSQIAAYLSLTKNGVHKNKTNNPNNEGILKTQAQGAMANLKYPLQQHSELSSDGSSHVPFKKRKISGSSSLSVPASLQEHQLALQALQQEHLHSERRLEQNRRAARASRNRKRHMVEDLQRSVLFFSRANANLSQQNQALERMLEQAQKQVSVSVYAKPQAQAPSQNNSTASSKKASASAGSAIPFPSKTLRCNKQEKKENEKPEETGTKETDDKKEAQCRRKEEEDKANLESNRFSYSIFPKELQAKNQDLMSNKAKIRRGEQTVADKIAAQTLYSLHDSPAVPRSVKKFPVTSRAPTVVSAASTVGPSAPTKPTMPFPAQYHFQQGVQTAMQMMMQQQQQQLSVLPPALAPMMLPTVHMFQQFLHQQQQRLARRRHAHGKDGQRRQRRDQGESKRTAV